LSSLFPVGSSGCKIPDCLDFAAIFVSAVSFFIETDGGLLVHGNAYGDVDCSRNSIVLKMYIHVVISNK